jgi:transposase-like protein
MPRSLARLVGPAVLSSKRRWTPADARAVLAQLDASGLTIREFAERQGLDRQRLDRWRMRLGRARAPAFVEISASVRGGAIEVVLRAGHVLRVPDGFEAETLRRVVEILDVEKPGC